MIQLGDELDSPLRAEHVRILPGVVEAIRQLNGAGLPVVVVSNQPVIAKGKTSAPELDRITRRIIAEVEAGGARIDAVYYCLHHPQAVVETLRTVCRCRKPAPGLLLMAADELGIDLALSVMVGDRTTDVEAGRRAGCRTILVGQPDALTRPTASLPPLSQPHDVASDLFEAAGKIVGWMNSVETSNAQPVSA
jgi:D-glycero-D-manno-heptose 1,7-bisphosphate phosphatase